jgi:hypothetical protein
MEVTSRILTRNVEIPHQADYFVFGDFVVCPLEKDAPCAMRSVSERGFARSAHLTQPIVESA